MVQYYRDMKHSEILPIYEYYYEGHLGDVGNVVIAHTVTHSYL